ncbi:MAG: zinc ribbon domain-containing protein [Pseudomonadota bacterium]
MEALEGFASGRFDTQAEVKRFLETQPAYMARRKNGVTFEDVLRLLTRQHYAGYIAFPDWGISLRKGHHESLVDLHTYERIQERLREGARVPARADINAEFPLRGFVTCGDCDKPLTACWSKSKTGKKHPYYLCFNKVCESYRKLIRREAVENEFETMLKGMQPTETLFNYVRVIFKGEWGKRLSQLQDI